MDTSIKDALQIAATPLVKILLALTVILIAVLLFMSKKSPDVDTASEPVTTDTRIPIRKPQLEPDRPDLLQEP